jgi:hypothetical protein
MATSQALNFILNAQNKTKPAFDQAEASIGRMGKALGAASMVTKAAAGLVGGTLVGALSDAARAAAEDEANVEKLRVAVENSGASWDENIDAIEQRIAAGQRLAFSDSDTRDSIAQLTTATGSATKAMELQGLVQDIARGRNISLAAATDIAQKAAIGQFGALKKLGVVIDETMTPTQALGELQKRYAGQADAYGKTTEAAMFRVKDAIGEWAESIGAALGPAQGLVAMLPGLSSGVSLWSAALAPAITRAGGLRNAVGALLGALNPVTLATRAWTLAQAALNLVMSANPIALVVLGLAALVAAFKIAYDRSAQFRNIVHSLFDWLGNLLKPLGWVWDRVMDLARSFGLVGDSSEEMKADVGADFEALRAKATAETEATASGVVSAADGMKRRVASIFDEMAEAGVGDTNDMKIRTILEAMGMKDGVLRAAEDMASGLGGWSEKARDKAIFDMQYAELEATLHAKGLADGVIAEITRMVRENRAALEKKKADEAAARDAMRERYDAMKQKQAELADSFGLPIERANELRAALEKLPAQKTVRLDYHERHMVTTTHSGSGSDASVIAAASGFDGIVGPGHGGARLILAGEGGAPEEVHVGPVGGRGRETAIAPTTINAYGIGVAEAARLIARENERMLARRAARGHGRRR